MTFLERRPSRGSRAGLRRGKLRVARRWALALGALVSVLALAYAWWSGAWGWVAASSTLLVCATSRLAVDALRFRRQGPSTRLVVGETAPRTTLDTRAGRSLSLPPDVDDFLLVTFVPGDWCPICQMQMRRYRKHVAGLRERGVRLVVVSPDAGPDAAALAEYLGLDYDIAMDPSLEIAEAFGVVDPSTSRGRLPIPSSFLVDREGVIRYASCPGDIGGSLRTKSILDALAGAPVPTQELEMDEVLRLT